MPFDSSSHERRRFPQHDLNLGSCGVQQGGRPKPALPPSDNGSTLTCKFAEIVVIEGVRRHCLWKMIELRRPACEEAVAGCNHNALSLNRRAVF